MNREFFTGHKLQVVHMLFVENSPNSMATVDANGHVYVWRYDKDRIASRKAFEPMGRFRIELKYYKFTRLTGETRLYPQTGKELDAGKVLTEKQVLQVEQYLEKEPSARFENAEGRAIDRYTQQSRNNMVTMVAPVVPQRMGDDTREFEELVYNSGRQLVRRAEVKFKPVEAVAKIEAIRNFKNNRFFIVCMGKEHLYGNKDFVTKEFIVYRPDENKLNRNKVTVHAERNGGYGWDISDEV